MESKFLKIVGLKTKRFINRNSPTILTVIGAVGFVSTIAVAVRNTVKATKIIENSESFKGEKLTKTEIVKIAAPSYIPTLVIGSATLICIFSANSISKKRQSSLIASYALLSETYREFKEKVKEAVGEEKEHEIKEILINDKFKEFHYDPILDEEDNSEIHIFYEEHYGKFFEATKEKVIKAEYQLNRFLSILGYASLNDFYAFLELEDSVIGDHIGWSYKNTNGWIEFDHEKIILDDGMECFSICMISPPCEDYTDMINQ